jgi:aminopeptidase N
MGRERGVLPKYRARGVKPAAAWMALTLLGACGGEGANGPAVEPRAGTPVATADPPAQAARPAPPPPRDDGRLPPTATPERYSISLRIDPDQLRFSGVASIQVSLPETTWHVVLNARDIHVTRAVARFSATAGGPLAEEVAATAEPRLAHGGVVPEELVLSLARPLPAGEAVLEIAYDAPFAPDLAGLYRVEENGRSYAYTQFEATDARRAFPCFDEPSFKTVYDVTIAAPRGLMVVANSPETSHEDTPDGAVVHKFETTRPLPSYLVAFAVGAFDVAQGQTDPFPIRVITTKGRAGLSQLALDAAAGLIAKLGDYFGVPYPYPKLDLVAVPDFSAGAMENPGLVTFRDVLILLDPKRATTALRRDQATVIAHEFAHQWFGDLVTMQWWDDVWLNEGFATWAEARIVDLWKPSFGAELDQIRGLSRVMDEDALRTARAVREPVHSTSEAEEAFDEITYEKGAAVLRMLERYLGADTFRRGLQQYIRANAWKNARADDLFAALDFVSAQHVGPLATSFLDHPGVPNVRADLRCTKGAAKLALAETEWRPLGESAGDARTWMLPVCIAADGLRGGSCFTLGPGGIERDLGAACPSWLYPNADQAGYYRYAIDRVQLLALARGASALPPLDRFGLVANAWAQVRAGTLDASTVLDMLPLLDRENDRNVLDQIVGTLEGVDAALVVDGDRAAFRKYVAARLGPRARALGWTAAPHEDDDRDGRARRGRRDAARRREVGQEVARRHGERTGGRRVGGRAARVGARGAATSRRAARRGEERVAARRPRAGDQGDGLLRRPGGVAHGARPRARRRAEAERAAVPVRGRPRAPGRRAGALRVGEGALGAAARAAPGRVRARAAGVGRRRAVHGRRARRRARFLRTGDAGHRGDGAPARAGARGGVALRRAARTRLGRRREGSPDYRAREVSGPAAGLRSRTRRSSSRPAACSRRRWSPLVRTPCRRSPTSTCCPSSSRCRSRRCTA